MTLLLWLACKSKPPGAMPAYEGRLAAGDRPVALVGDASEPMPTLVLLGGYRWMSWELEQEMGLAPHVDGFRLALPTATLDKKNRPFWNATDTCCDFYGQGTDDLGYLRGVMDELQGRTTEFWVVGHSNGAFMGFALACHDERVSHLVSIAGSSYLDASLCPERRDIALLQIHGTDDEVMPYEGDETAPGVDALFQRWGCPDANCELWLMPGEDHYMDWSGDLTARIVRWLRTHSAG